MQNKARLPILLLLVALAGMALLLVSTARGPGIGGDATIYITAAQNLIQGKGLGLIGPQGEFRLLPYFPPFFSLVLSAFGTFGLNLAQAAHWLNMILFGATAWMIGYLTYKATQSEWMSVLIAGLIVISPVSIPVYSWAISEPLSIFLGFAGLALLLAYLKVPEKTGLLIGAAVVTGLAFLTRYSAAAYLGAWALLILVTGNRPLRERIKDALMFGLTGSVPMAIWVVYDMLNTATVGSRSLESALGMAERFKNFWPQLEGVLLFWVIPDSWINAPFYPALLNHVLVVAATVLLAVGWVWLLRNKSRSLSAEDFDEARTQLLALGLYGLVYLLVILFVYVTTYPPITIGSRMLSPVHVAVIWLVGIMTGQGLELKTKSPWIKRSIIAVLVLVAGWYGIRSLRIVQQNNQLGLGYSSLEWQSSETMQAVEALPEDTLIITNEETAVLYLTGRASYALQEIYQQDPDERLEAFGSGEPDEAEVLFREEGAALVLFDTIYAQLDGIYGDRTDERVESLTEGLFLSFEGLDGQIYYYDKP